MNFDAAEKLLEEVHLSREHSSNCDSRQPFVSYQIAPFAATRQRVR